MVSSFLLAAPVAADHFKSCFRFAVGRKFAIAKNQLLQLFVEFTIKEDYSNTVAVQFSNLCSSVAKTEFKSSNKKFKLGPVGATTLCSLYIRRGLCDRRFWSQGSQSCHKAQRLSPLNLPLKS